MQRGPGDTCTWSELHDGEETEARGTHTLPMGSQHSPAPEQGTVSVPRGCSPDVHLWHLVPVLCLPNGDLNSFSGIIMGYMQSGEGNPQVSKQSCYAQHTSTAESYWQSWFKRTDAHNSVHADLSTVSTHRQFLFLQMCKTLTREMPAHSHSQQLSPRRTGNWRPLKPQEIGNPCKQKHWEIFLNKLTTKHISSK